MKKSKLLILGVIALLLVGGLVLASCDLKTKDYCTNLEKGVVKGTGLCSFNNYPKEDSDCSYECIYHAKQNGSVKPTCSCSETTY